MLRILLLVVTNFAVLLLASITLSLLGVGPWLTAHGIDYASLIVVGAVIGFGGAFFSLAISKWMAKRTMGVQVITTPRNETEAWLLATVEREASAAGIRPPEVGVFDSPEPNAFATGARRDAALVAVSSGLLARMRRSEAEAVLGHELTHVANGDMVTLTLIQGVVNTFVFVLSRVIGNLVDRVVFRNDDERGAGPAFWITTIVAQVILSFLATMVVMWFSRRREFRADAGGARLGGRANMIGALEALKRVQNEGLPANMQAFGVAGPDRVSGLKRLFMSHPPLDERIAALRATT
jgi:heat shock protein HtpX